MNDQLDRNAQKMLDDLRGFENPTLEDRARNRRGLAVKMGAAAVAVAVSAKVAEGAGTAVVANFSLGKLIIAAMMVTAVGGGIGLGVLKSRVREADARAAKAAAALKVAQAAPAAVVAPPTQETVPVEPAPPLQEKEKVARPRRVAEPVVASASQLAEETALLATAREALRSGQAGVALARLDGYVNRFPAGVLREEHAATRIFVLGELDRRDEACRESQAFARAWPRSPLLVKVASACGPTPNK